MVFTKRKITSFRFYLLHIGCCPDNCSCLSTVSFRAIFKCALYRHLQLVPSPSSHSSSLMTDTLALHSRSSLYQEVYVSTIHLELTFNIKINCAAHRKICYQTVNIIKHITLHWRERRVSFSEDMIYLYGHFFLVDLLMIEAWGWSNHHKMVLHSFHWFRHISVWIFLKDERNLHERKDRQRRNQNIQDTPQSI